MVKKVSPSGKRPKTAKPSAPASRQNSPPQNSKAKKAPPAGAGASSGAPVNQKKKFQSNVLNKIPQNGIGDALDFLNSKSGGKIYDSVIKTELALKKVKKSLKKINKSFSDAVKKNKQLQLAIKGVSGALKLVKKTASGVLDTFKACVRTVKAISTAFLPLAIGSFALSAIFSPVALLASMRRFGEGSTNRLSESYQNNASNGQTKAFNNIFGNYAGGLPSRLNSAYYNTTGLLLRDAGVLSEKSYKSQNSISGALDVMHYVRGLRKELKGLDPIIAESIYNSKGNGNLGNVLPFQQAVPLMRMSDKAFNEHERLYRGEASSYSLGRGQDLTYLSLASRMRQAGDRMESTFFKAMEPLVPSFVNLSQAVGRVFSSLSGFLEHSGAIEKLAGYIDKIASEDNIEAATNKIKDAIQYLSDALPPMVDKMGEIISQISDGLATLASVLHKFKQYGDTALEYAEMPKKSLLNVGRAELEGVKTAGSYLSNLFSGKKKALFDGASDEDSIRTMQMLSGDMDMGFVPAGLSAPVQLSQMNPHQVPSMPAKDWMGDYDKAISISLNNNTGADVNVNARMLNIGMEGG